MTSPALQRLAELEREIAEESDGERSRSDGDTIGVSPALQRLAELERTIAEQSDSEGVDDDEAGTEEELEQNDDRPSFSCWSTRGNWTLHGYTWYQANSTAGTELFERVKQCLLDNDWCYNIDFSNAVPHSSSWFHLTPATLTPRQAKVLASKCSCALKQDYLGFVHGTRLPEAQQHREELSWVHVWAFHWNMARGWCASDGCVHRNVPLRFTAMGLVKGGNKRAALLSFSLQRDYNECHHQWWNISGVLHTDCNSRLNSHPTRGFCTERSANLTMPPYSPPLGDDGGGPTGHFADTWGGLVTAPIELDPNKCRASNMRRINIWLRQNNYVHSDDCSPKGGYRKRTRTGACLHDDCPFGNKRADIIEEAGGEDALGRWQVDNRRHPNHHRRRNGGRRTA